MSSMDCNLVLVKFDISVFQKPLCKRFKFQAQGSWASECSLYAEQMSFSHPVNGERTEDEGHISDAVELDTLLASPAQTDEQIDNHNTKVFAGSAASITENLETAVVETHDETMYDSTDHMEKSPVYSGFELRNCDGRSLSKISMKELHAELCTLLTNRAALPVWTSWLDRTVSRTLADQVTGTKRASAARHLMLVWTYYRRRGTTHEVDGSVVHISPVSSRTLSSRCLNRQMCCVSGAVPLGSADRPVNRSAQLGQLLGRGVRYTSHIKLIG
ncbi:hypothetical protein T265_03266 [Opisthorchis viverrini]|uniref:RFX1-4/6/8-like BCD domain-containing protein n=1 Tax=Opisthorchis viverrini TaxID=6198 RepID=A0A074ZT78_OPIVI|nr:hypothetical protein T265_03266 [Opisthorchis viverrini]KER30321.1 hypothetical protein T265_03266 [Opisthorchis viverrini]